MSANNPSESESRRPEDFFASSARASAWPKRVRQEAVRVRIITLDELRSWIVYEDAQLLVISKPGDVVCHPSKAGPWSSLVGAVREYTRLLTVHLVFRLDRETSGIVVLAKDPATASRLQTAMMKRQVGKNISPCLREISSHPATAGTARGPCRQPSFREISGAPGWTTLGHALHANKRGRGIHAGAGCHRIGPQTSDPRSCAVARSQPRRR